MQVARRWFLQIWNAYKGSRIWNAYVQRLRFCTRTAVERGPAYLQDLSQHLTLKLLSSWRHNIIIMPGYCIFMTETPTSSVKDLEQTFHVIKLQWGAQQRGYGTLSQLSLPGYLLALFSSFLINFIGETVKRSLGTIDLGFIGPLSPHDRTGCFS